MIRSLTTTEAASNYSFVRLTPRYLTNASAAVLSSTNTEKTDALICMRSVPSVSAALQWPFLTSGQSIFFHVSSILFYPKNILALFVIVTKFWRIHFPFFATMLSRQSVESSEDIRTPAELKSDDFRVKSKRLVSVVWVDASITGRFAFTAIIFIQMIPKRLEKNGKRGEIAWESGWLDNCHCGRKPFSMFKKQRLRIVWLFTWKVSGWNIWHILASNFLVMHQLLPNVLQS